jgi:hypothetical protein
MSYVLILDREAMQGKKDNGSSGYRMLWVGSKHI